METTNSIIPELINAVNMAVLLVNVWLFSDLINKIAQKVVTPPFELLVGLYVATLIALNLVNVSATINHYLFYFYHNQTAPYAIIWIRFADRWAMLLLTAVLTLIHRTYLYKLFTERTH